MVVIVICMHLLFCEPSIEPIKKIEEENMKGLFVLHVVSGGLYIGIDSLIDRRVNTQRYRALLSHTYIDC